MKRVRVVSWNMARAVRPSGLDGDPWEALAGLAPDVALLQEAREPPSDFGGTLHLNRTRHGWGTGIWSPFELSGPTEIPGADAGEMERLLPALEGYVAGASVRIGDALELDAISVHAYPEAVAGPLLAGLDPLQLRTPSSKAVWPGDLIWWLTRKLPGQGAPTILGGDWNTSRLFDEVYGPRGNQEFFDRMAESGWNDALRKFNEEEVQTYFKDGTGPYQLDHVFGTRQVHDWLVNGFVQSGGEILGASDHAALVLDLEIPRSS